MPDILQEFPITADRETVFRAISEPAGLDCWWTLTCSGEPREGEEYSLGFGPGYDWRARVTRSHSPDHFELELVRADDDWLGSRITFLLDERDGVTVLRFAHTGWPQAITHFRVSAHCWALYLRLLRRYLEHGDVVPYDRRLDA